MVYQKHNTVLKRGNLQILMKEIKIFQTWQYVIIRNHISIFSFSFKNLTHYWSQWEYSITINILLFFTFILGDVYKVNNNFEKFFKYIVLNTCWGLNKMFYKYMLLYFFIANAGFKQLMFAKTSLSFMLYYLDDSTTNKWICYTYCSSRYAF